MWRKSSAGSRAANMGISIPSASQTPIESNLQKEWRLFGELFSRLIDALLNRMFDLRPDKAARRLWYLIVLFLLSGFLLSFLYYPPLWWGQRIQDVFSFFLRRDFAESYPGNAFVNLFVLGAKALFDPRIFQYFPIFLGSFFIALQGAAL